MPWETICSLIRVLVCLTDCVIYGCTVIAHGRPVIPGQLVINQGVGRNSPDSCTQMIVAISAPRWFQVWVLAGHQFHNTQIQELTYSGVMVTIEV